MALLGTICNPFPDSLYVLLRKTNHNSRYCSVPAKRGDGRGGGRAGEKGGKGKGSESER